MDYGPLVTEEIDAGRDLVRRFDKSIPIKVAFWLKANHTPFRYLYLASESITSHNFDVAYGEVLRVAREIRSPHLDPFRVKVIGADDPLAQAAILLNELYPGRVTTHLDGRTFGGQSVDDVYVYPTPVPVGV